MATRRKPRRRMGPDPLVKGMEVRREGAGMFGDTVKRVVDVRAPSPKHGKNADDQAVILTYRRYPNGKRGPGKIDVMDAEKAYPLFEKKT